MSPYSNSQFATAGAAAAAIIAAAVAGKLLIDRTVSIRPIPSDNADTKQKRLPKPEHAADHHRTMPYNLSFKDLHSLADAPPLRVHRVQLQTCIQTQAQKLPPIQEPAFSQNELKQKQPQSLRQLQPGRQSLSQEPKTKSRQQRLQQQQQQKQQQQYSPEHSSKKEQRQQQQQQEQQQQAHTVPEPHRALEHESRIHQHQPLTQSPLAQQHISHQYPSNSAPLQWAVFWDLENVAVPRGVTGHSLVHSLRTRLTSLRPGTIVRIIAAGNIFHLPVHLRNQLQASGVSLNHVETRGRKDAADKALITELCLLAAEHSPPFGVALLSGDADFAYALARMRNLGYFTVVVASSRGKVCGALLKAVGNVVWGLREDVLETTGNATDSNVRNNAEVERLKGRADELEAESKVACSQSAGEGLKIGATEAMIKRRKRQAPGKRFDAERTDGAERGGRRRERRQVGLRGVGRGVVAEDVDSTRLSRLLSSRRGTPALLMMLGCVMLTAGLVVAWKSLLNGMQFDPRVTERGLILVGLFLLGCVLTLSSWRGSAGRVVRNGGNPSRR